MTCIFVFENDLARANAQSTWFGGVKPLAVIEKICIVFPQTEMPPAHLLPEKINGLRKQGLAVLPYQTVSEMPLAAVIATVDNGHGP